MGYFIVKQKKIIIWYLFQIVPTSQSEVYVTIHFRNADVYICST